MSHLTQLQKAFTKLEIENDFIAYGPVSDWLSRAQTIIDKELQQRQNAVNGYVFYPGRMADGFNQEGNLVKSVLLHHRGIAFEQDTSGMIVMETLLSFGLHPEWPGGKNVIHLSPFLELRGLLRLSQRAEAEFFQEGIGHFLMRRDEAETQPWSLFHWKTQEDSESDHIYRADGPEMLIIMAEEDFPGIRHWLAHFKPVS